ncbi:g9567 [Coccomyxa elongata]
MDGSPLFGFSCSHTTRAPREGEKHGVHYFFVSKEEFEKGIEEGAFLEYARVHSNIYGTSFQAVEDLASSGKCCILDIDVQGARLVRRSKLKAIFVFVAPPSTQALEQRLRGRGTESEEQIQERLQAAKEEIASIKEPGLYDYVIFNDDLDEAFAQLTLVARRALAGQQGNGSGSISGPVTLVADEEPETAAEGPSGQPSAAPQAVPAPQADNETSEKAPLLPSAASAEAPQSKAVKDIGAAPNAAAAPPAPATDSVAASNPAGLGRWRGKVAIVTGASAGIGWAVCEVLAEAGMRVVAVARRRERLEALQQLLVSRGVPIADFLPVVCDITKEAEVVALPRIIVKRWPGMGVDVLVNNAGLGRNNAALWDGSTASWVEMISTNVLGVCMCTREALKDMTRRGQYGHIINISSMSGHRVPNGASGGAFYAATKHALRALTEGLRQEARGRKVDLRVSSISPGVVETEFLTVHGFGDDAAAKERYSSMQSLQPADIAQAVVWCLSAPDHVDTNDILLRPVRQES